MTSFLKSFLATFVLGLFLVGMASQSQAQIETLIGEDETGTKYRVQTDIPIRTDLPRVGGQGLPSYFYVVQLARFERMHQIPEQFPKGTFLWMNPDDPKEMILYAGFYGSLEDAKFEAKKWKANPMFPGAYAKPNPFLIKYD